MSRNLFYLSFVFCFLFAPIFPAMAENGDNKKQELAQRYYELNPSWKIVSAAIRERAQNFDPQKRLVFITAMEKLIDKKELRQASIPLIMELFSEKELESMIFFYSDPAIRSALAKQETLLRRLSPVVTEMMDEAYMRYLTEQDAAPAPR